MSVPALLVAALLAQAAPGEVDIPGDLTTEKPREEVKGAPWYLPRSLELGTFIQKGLVAPNLRFDWELTMLQSHHDALVFVVEGLVSYAGAFPNVGFGPGATSTMTLFYQHSVMGGVAYRGTYESGFRWGFSVLSGPVWYGAHWSSAKVVPENNFDGWIDGRVQAGWQFGPVVVGVTGGYTALYNQPRGFVLSGPYAGGIDMGIVIDWRPLPRPNAIF